ncbi:MAG: DNA primase [Dehalococcoidia bacterium]|nr:DNA primase [Dehalococcoidia bacterium]
MNEVEEVKARLDIVEVIGQYVQLQKAGRTFKAPCPFHNERTPSFTVSPERQSWHCFGACGTGGDVISFVMRREGLEFPEALRLLAERAGVKLPERRQSEERERQNERLYAASEAAAHWFRKRLLEGDSGSEARAYLERRGVDAPTAEAFLLGFSPPGWEDLLGHLRDRGFSDRELLTAGLVAQGERGLHDRFHNRLMFPIWDAKGRVTGFGARALDPAGGSGQAAAKYINTSQTAIFDKGGMLYPLHRAQAAIRREGHAVIVEGYMDAIAAHQHGFDNVVASMGTALTERQVRLLKRLTSQIVLALDADAAGSEAAVRGHDVVRGALGDSAGAVPVVSWRGLVGYQEAVAVDLRVAVLPPGRDPDEVVRADPEQWRGLVAEAQPVLDYRLQASAASHELTNPRGRSQFVQEFLPLLSAVADPVVRAHYLQRLSRLSQTGEEELSAMLAQNRGRKGPAPQAAAVAGRSGDQREQFLLAVLVQYPGLAPEGLEVPPELLWEVENQQVFAAWKACPEPEAVKETVPLELRDHVERLMLRRLPLSDLKQAREALLSCRRTLEHRQLEAEKQAVGALLAAREEELGVSALAEAAASGAEEDERLREAVRLHQQDMETGLRLHRQERSDGDDNDPVEAGING